MEKFSVLPTDERFFSLYEEQKLGIFEGISSLPDEKVLKKRVYLYDRIAELEKKELEKFATPGLIKRMKEGMAAEGLTKEQIERQVNRNLGNMKAIELKKLNEELNG